MVTHQLQVERRTGKVRQSETDVLPLCHATNRVWAAFLVRSVTKRHTAPRCRTGRRRGASVRITKALAGRTGLLYRMRRGPSGVAGRLVRVHLLQRPDLENILRQSYDCLTIMPKVTIDLRRTSNLLNIPRIRYDTRCYFNVRSKADISQLNLPHEGRKAFLRYDSLAKL